MEQLSFLEQSRVEDPSCDDPTHVIRLAEQVLDDLQAEPPVDLRMVASYQDIADVRYCVLPNAGCLVTNPRSGRVEIRLRNDDSHSRQRFTGFHEVTHTFMPGYRLTTQHRCDPSLIAPAKRTVEQLCDLGASELLLPRRPFAAHLAEASFGMDTVFDLADTYDASLQATAHRFVALWPEDTLLVVAEVANKPKDVAGAPPRLRIRYSTGRGEWPFIFRHKSIDEGEPLTRALAGDFVDESAPLRGFASREVEGVQVSARCCSYTDNRGDHHDRVLALYRRPAARN